MDNCFSFRQAMAICHEINSDKYSDEDMAMEFKFWGGRMTNFEKIKKMNIEEIGEDKIKKYLFEVRKWLN